MDTLKQILSDIGYFILEVLNMLYELLPGVIIIWFIWYIITIGGIY